MDDLISIIIPVYNVEKYLRRCIESVVNQTYKNLEIILVDDGSSDLSGDICDEYANKDTRVKVIHKENGGQSDARNKALDVSLGEYITFIDSDDWVSEQYVEKLYFLLQNNEADISCVNFKKMTEKISQEAINKKKEKQWIFSGKEAIKDMWYQKHICVAPWGKLFRRKILKEIRFPHGRIYEDLATTYKMFFLANKVIWNAEPLYFYFQRDDSTMHCDFNERKMDRITVSHELLEWAETKCPEVLDAARTRFFTSNVQVLREIPNCVLYQEEILSIQKNIEENRDYVIFDKEAKMIIRVIAVCAILDIRVLKIFGKLYKMIWK